MTGISNTSKRQWKISIFSLQNCQGCCHGLLAKFSAFLWHICTLHHGIGGLMGSLRMFTQEVSTAPTLTVHIQPSGFRSGSSLWIATGDRLIWPVYHRKECHEWELKVISITLVLLWLSRVSVSPEHQTTISFKQGRGELVLTENVQRILYHSSQLTVGANGQSLHSCE